MLQIHNKLLLGTKCVNKDGFFCRVRRNRMTWTRKPILIVDRTCKRVCMKQGLANRVCLPDPAYYLFLQGLWTKNDFYICKGWKTLEEKYCLIHEDARKIKFHCHNLSFIGTRPLICLYMVCCCSHAASVELSSCNRVYMVCKAWNIVFTI